METLSAVPLSSLPFPAWLVDREDRILAVNDLAADFPPVDRFLELTEDSVREEARRYLHAEPCPSEPRIMRLRPRARADWPWCEIRVREALGHRLVCCLPRDEEPGIHETIRQMERDIQGISHALLERKEQLTHSLRELEELAVQHDKLASVGTMAAGIAHEIRNPLASVRGFVQMLKPHLAQLGKERYAVIALEEIDRANGIIHEFLRASKPEKTTLAEVPASRLVGDIAALCSSEAELAGARIVVETAADDLMLRVDANQMKQVLLNLVRNAIEAVSDAEAAPGEVRLRIDSGGGACRIAVRDNGCGMDEAALARLFEPFYTTKATGTGIGLTVCRNIVHHHGGSISVQSQPGIGTVFTVELPVA